MSDNMPLVSVIMPVYNAEKYVASSIQSVINQSYQSWELLIINDGSTDNSESIILKIQDDRIHYLNQQNQGVSAARNVGLRNMNGDYFCFLDADDLLAPDSILFRLQAFSEDREVEFVDGQVEIFQDEVSKPKGNYMPNFEGNPFNKLVALSEECFFGITWMIKRVNDKSYHFKESLSHGEDLLFYMSIAQTGIYKSIREVIYQRRIVDGSAMSNLRQLELGYKTILSEVSKFDRVNTEQIEYLRKKIKSILVKSNIRSGNFFHALNVLFR